MVFDESKHARGTGAAGGQFVSKGGAKSSSLGFDSKSGRGAGYGERGGDANVKKLQRALNKLGITDSAGRELAVDGKFGPKTTASLMRLQRRLGLKPDGKITPALLARIGKIKKKTTLSEPVAKKVAPAAKKVAPAKNVAGPGRAVSVRNPGAPVRRSVRYSMAMESLQRHGTHNQKSHGNRLGRPENVGGKTGLAKATSALADKPDLKPETPEESGARKAREFAAQGEVEIREQLIGETGKRFARLLGEDGKDARITNKTQREALEAMRDGGWKFVNQVIDIYTLEAPDGTQVRLFPQGGGVGFGKPGGGKLNASEVRKLARDKKGK